MASIYWRPAGSESAYGEVQSAAEMDAYDASIVEFLESCGHTVEIGARTDSDQCERSSDELTDEELHTLFGEAWDYACRNVELPNDA